MGDILGDSGSILGKRKGEAQTESIDFGDYVKNTPKPEAASTLDMIEGGARALNRGLMKTPVGVMDFAATLGSTLAGTDITQDYLYKGARGLENFVDEFQKSNNALPKPVEAVTEGVGQIGGQVLSAAATGGESLVAQSLRPLAGMNIAGMGTTQGINDARDSQASPEDIKTAATFGSLTGLTEFAPVEKILGIADKAAPGLKAKIVNVLATGGMEGLQEWVQQVGTNLTAKLTYDQERELAKGAREAAQVGGATGIVAATIATMFGIKPKGLFNNNSKSEEVLDAEDVTESHLSTALKRNVEKTLDAEWSELGQVGPANPPASKQLPEPVYEGDEIKQDSFSTLVREPVTYDGQVLQKIADKYSDSPLRQQYAIEYAKKKLREQKVNVLPQEDQIDLPAEAQSLGTPVDVKTEDAELQTLQDMIKDPNMSAEDKKVLQGRLDELQGTQTIERRLNDSQRKTINDLIEAKDIDGIAKLIYHDDLTGLMNKRSWDEAERLANMVGAHVGSLDLAGVKYINDTFGHAAGDEMFKILGGELKDSGTLLFRKGGDEFAAVFEKGQDPNEILSKLRQNVAKLKAVLTDENGNKKTFSGWSLDYGTGEDFKSADAELYARRADAEASGKRNPIRGEKPYGLVTEEQQTGDDSQLRESEVEKPDPFSKALKGAVTKEPKGYADESADDTLQFYRDLAEGNPTEQKPKQYGEPTTVQASKEFTKLGDAWIAPTEDGQTIAIIKEGKQYKGYVGSTEEIQQGTAEEVGTYPSLPKARKALSQPVETTPIEPISKVDFAERLKLLKQANQKAQEAKIAELLDDNTFSPDDAEEFVSWEDMQEEEAVQDLYEDQYETRDFEDIAKDLFTILSDTRGSLHPKGDPEIAAAKKRLNNDVKRLVKLAKRFAIKLFHYPGLVLNRRGEAQKVYHGTIKAFDENSGKNLGAYTGAPSAKLGHFFAGKPETANAYTGYGEAPEHKTMDEVQQDAEERAADPKEAPYIYLQTLGPLHKQVRDIHLDESRIMQKAITAILKHRSNGITREILKQLNVLSDQMFLTANNHKLISNEVYNSSVYQAVMADRSDDVVSKRLRDVINLLAKDATQYDIVNREYQQKFSERLTNPEMVDEFNKYVEKTHKNYNFDLYDQVKKEVLNGDYLRQQYKEYLQSTVKEFQDFGKDFANEYSHLSESPIAKDDMWKLLHEINKGLKVESTRPEIGRYIKNVIEKLPPAEKEILQRNLARLSNNYEQARSNLKEHEDTLYSQLNKSQSELVDEIIQKSPHAPNVRVANLIMQRPFTYDMKGQEYREKSYYDIIKEAWEKGHDGVIIKNTYDGGPLDDIYVVKKTEQIIPYFEREAAIIEGLWKRLGKHLGNERGSVDMSGAYGLAAELAKKMRKFMQMIKEYALRLHQWMEQGKRMAANQKITDEQQQKDSSALTQYTKSIVHAYKTDLKGAAKELVDYMKSTDRIVPEYKKGQGTPPKRQQIWISKKAPGIKPGAEGYSIGWLKRNFRTPSGMFRNIFPVGNNPSIDMAESQMAFINNTANDLKWYKDVVGKIPNNSDEVRKRLDVFYKEYNKLRQAMDRESRKIQGWTEKLRATQDPEERTKLKNKIKAATKRNKSKIMRLNEGLRVVYDSEFSQLCEDYSDVRITAQVLEVLPEGITLTDEEMRVASLVKDYFRRSKEDMIKKGLPVVEGRNYIHHIIPQILNDPDSQAFARRNNLPASLKFLHQSEDGRPWYPSIHDILQSYIPLVNKKLAHEEFLQKWQPAIAAMPTDIHRYMTDWVEENLFRKPYTPFERAVNRVVEFEYIRLTGMSLSVMFKHGSKAIDTLMRYDAMTNAKAVQSVIRATAGRIAKSVGANLDHENAEFELIKAFVNMNTLLQMTTEFPILAQSGNILKRMAGAGVNMVEFLDNGVTAFATLMSAHNANMTPEQASKIIWDTMLAANFRGGHDMPFAYRNPIARPFLMFQSTVQKLWGYRGSILKGAINGEKDNFGTYKGMMLVRMIIMFGLAEGLMRDWFGSSIVDQALHTPYLSHLVTAERGGYALHEPKLSGSPVVDFLYNAAKKGVGTATKDEFSYWGEMTKIANTLHGKYPKNYYRSPVMYHLGISKVHTGKENTSRRGGGVRTTSSRSVSGSGQRRR